MLISSVLVLMMSHPRAGAVLWRPGPHQEHAQRADAGVHDRRSPRWSGCSWGYSMAFTSGNSRSSAGFSKAFLANVVFAATYAATFSNNVYLPEYVFVVFQMTFACITPALIVGAFAERVKFTPLMLFTVLWLTIVYFPIAHMVWYWAGPDFLPDAPTDTGYLWGMGALDFAGGTVVHINAGIAGLVGCIMIGKRIGYGKEATPPHSLTMTMIGASLLWVGWFGFNAGSNLEANGVTARRLHQHLRRHCRCCPCLGMVEQIHHGKPSMLGAVTGAVAGLVAITPASGFATPMTSIYLGSAGIAAVLLLRLLCEEQAEV
jgi:Amt family ammonium transporter